MCAFATKYSATCAACANAPESDVHCACLFGVLPAGYSEDLFQGATRGVCVATAPFSLIDGDYTPGDASTSYALITTNFDDTIVLGGTFATDTLVKK